MENNNDLLLKLTKEIEEKNKTIWNCMWIIMTISILCLILADIAIVLLIPEGIWQVVLVFVTIALFLVPCFYALKLEISIGVYKCEKCGKEFVPTISHALWSMHCGTTRYLKCPDCDKRSWCKKIIK